MTDLEALKAKARIARKRRKKDDPSQLRDGDILVILHPEEVRVIEDLLCDALIYWEDTLPIDEKRTILNVLKHIQSDEEGEYHE